MAVSTPERPRTNHVKRVNEFWVGHSSAGVGAASAGSYGLAPQPSVTASSSSPAPGGPQGRDLTQEHPVASQFCRLSGCRVSAERNSEMHQRVFQVIIIMIPLLWSSLGMYCGLESQTECWDR